MVKPKSVVWRYYGLKDRDHHSCKYCKTSFKRNATRQFQHLLKCVKIPENVVQILEKGILPVRNVSDSNNNTTPSSTEVLEDSDTETTSQQGQGESLDSEIASLVRPALSSVSSSFSSTSKAIKSEKSMSGPVWWAENCSSSKISRLAVDILNLPSSTAATERTFSTYGFIDRQRRNRLTVKRAGKLTYIAHNYNLLNKEDHSRIVEATDEEIEKEDIGFEVIHLTQLTKEKEESDDEFGEDDEDDLPLSTLLRSPF
ncbi:hAT family C-terminal dimerization region [Popillia japonica]|uniref:HAT family C-terminal dimerization region n=1 Tax=Popillia japonica TaxID=7064 RepID=A0AAW1L697_POPJA